GKGPSFRVENRIPGGDVNPYYAYSATIAAGLDGIARELPAPDIFDGNASRVLAHATSGPALQQNLGAVLEGEV
ncbi:glutamine synthetase, partial [Enterococcus faecium]